MSASAQEPLPIGIAVVEHHGRYLVGVRPEGSELAGLWEFPGGKCLPDEGTGRCACRECLEETGLEVLAVDLLMRRSHVYPHGTRELHFWLCRPTGRAEVKEEHGRFRWVPTMELPLLQFPEGNAPVIQLLTGG